MARFRDDGKWWLDEPELIARAEREQAERYEGDPWDRRVAGYLRGLSLTGRPLEVTIEEILQHLGLPTAQWSKREKNRVGAILRSFGWRKDRVGKADPVTGRRPRVFLPPPRTSPSSSHSQHGDGVGDAINPNDYNEMSPTSPRVINPRTQTRNTACADDKNARGYGVYREDGDVGDVGDISLKTNEKVASPTPSPTPDDGRVGDVAGLDEADREERRAIEEIDGRAAPVCSRCGFGDLPHNKLMRFADGHLEHGTCPIQKERQKLKREQSQRAAANGRGRP